MDDKPLDCLVIGGGPAGLTAAIYLSRYHLGILVVDGGKSRAATIPCTHNHAGYPEGMEAIEKWIAKADHGFRHSAAFTLQNFKEPIEITPADRLLVLENCHRCHGELVQALRSDPVHGAIDCLHCHRHAGHGAFG